MSSRKGSRARLYLTVAPIVVALAVSVVGYYADQSRKKRVMDSAFRKLSYIRDLTSRAIGYGGIGIVGEMIEGERRFFSTMDIYVCAADGRFITKPRFLTREAVDSGAPCGPSAAAVTSSGRQGVRVAEDYRGQQVVSAYAPVRAGDSIYALLVELDVDEVEGSVSEPWYYLGQLFSLLVATTAVMAGRRLAGVDSSEAIKQLKAALYSMDEEDSPAFRSHLLGKVLREIPLSAFIVQMEPEFGSIWAVSRSFAKSFGYGDSELRGVDIAQLLPAFTRDDGSAVRQEMTGVLKGGSALTVALSMSCLKVGGRVYGMGLARPVEEIA